MKMVLSFVAIVVVALVAFYSFISSSEQEKLSQAAADEIFAELNVPEQDQGGFIVTTEVSDTHVRVCVKPRLTAMVSPEFALVNACVTEVVKANSTRFGDLADANLKAATTIAKAFKKS
jgi:hypothetical protein